MKTFFRRMTFNLWYFFKPPWDSGISPPELLDYIEKHPAGQAIDIGCGTGTNVITLARAGWQVTGIDFVPRAIQMARRKVKAAGLGADLRVGDATDLGDLGDHFDLALDIGCFHGLGEHKADYLSELERILAPGGHWLLYAIFASPQSSLGLAEADLGLIPASLALLERQDSPDQRGRPSAWFLFRKERS